ncbi:MAG: hypothetical protein PHC88_10640 [Terrimicrobiaceae bacterium]|nr:hypothetical protein [Terrimicrobiaceae bacterium]
MNSDRIEARLLDWIANPARAASGDMLLEVHAFQREANPAYGRYCAQFPSPSAWREIPAVPQRLFKEHAIRAFPSGETARTFRTSGTTGEGCGEHHFRSLRLYEAAATRGWELEGLGHRRVLALMPPPAEAPHSSLSQMASWLCEGEKAFFVRDGQACWEDLTGIAAAAREPLALFGPALAFLDWFEWLGERTLALPAGSVAIETGGYKGTRRELSKPELYARFAARLGLDAESVRNEYGMTELSSQFYGRGIGAPHVGPLWARALVVDPATGREVEDGGIGVLRLFDAANLGSVCAVQTQDLAIRRGENFELIGRDPAALPRGCSRAADEMLATRIAAP